MSRTSVLFFFLVSTVYSGNILVFNPTLGYSHVKFIGNIADILARGGHNVTVWAPIFDRDVNPIGTTESSIRTFVQETGNSVDFSSERVSYVRPWDRPWHQDPWKSRSINTHDVFYLLECTQRLFQAILDDNQFLQQLKEENFDLAVAELFSYVPLGIFETLDIRNTIVASSLGTFPGLHDITGLPRSPSFVPAFITTYSEEMTFLQRLDSCLVNLLEYTFNQFDLYQQNRLIRQYYPAVPDLYELIQKRVGIIFSNTNELTESPRPQSNMIKYIGGAGIYPPQSLPQNFELLLGQRKSTVIFSLGTVIDSCSMSVNRIVDLFSAFSQFPDVTFLWRFPSCNNRTIPWDSHPNVFRVDWIPQSDLLADRRVKAFITHGGMNSMTEAVFRGKPIISIPLFADQFVNSQNAVKRGYGISIQLADLSGAMIEDALEKVLAVNSFFQADRLRDDSVENSDIFVYSSYYFPKSKSLGDNAVAIVFTADFELVDHYSQLHLRLSSKEKTSFIKADVQIITPNQKCKWISYYVVAEGVPSLEKVAISTGDRFVEIPTKIPSSNYHDVVTCIAPLFASEQWQLAILSAHVYKRFGSHMHLYARSMVSPLYELMREYEKEGYLTLQPWYRIHLDSVAVDDFNPNMVVEFRSQAIAQSDCLLQYKERAAYISFVDLDDILIPRLGATYFDEFEEIFSMSSNAAYFTYGKENVHASISRTAEGFSISDTIFSIEFEQTTETGKFVTQPKFVNATWIHWPPSVPQGMEKYQVPNSVNAMTHLKHLTRVAEMDRRKVDLPLYQPDEEQDYDPKELLSMEDLEAIEGDYRRMAAIPRVRQLMDKLPEEFFYAKLIGDCYANFYKLYYSGQLTKIKCFGPERCQFPSSLNISCYNAVASYKSHNGPTLNVHFALSSSFKLDDGCIR